MGEVQYRKIFDVQHVRRPNVTAAAASSRQTPNASTTTWFPKMDSHEDQIPVVYDRLISAFPRSTGQTTPSQSSTSFFPTRHKYPVQKIVAAIYLFAPFVNWLQNCRKLLRKLYEPHALRSICPD